MKKKEPEASDAGDGGTSMAELRRAQLEWHRATQAADFEYRRRLDEAWAQYQRELNEAARECSQQVLDASEAGLTQGASPEETAEALRSSQRRANESFLVAAQRRRAAERRYEEERQGAWSDAADAVEAANVAYRRAVDDLFQAAAGGTIDPGADEGGGSVSDERYSDPAWGYRWR